MVTLAIYMFVQFCTVCLNVGVFEVFVSFGPNFVVYVV